MSTSYDAWTRGRVLRGHAAAARPAFLDTELGRAPTLKLVTTPETAEPAAEAEISEGHAEGYEQGYVEGFTQRR